MVVAVVAIVVVVVVVVVVVGAAHAAKAAVAVVAVLCGVYSRISRSTALLHVCKRRKQRIIEQTDIPYKHERGGKK